MLELDWSSTWWADEQGFQHIQQGKRAGLLQDRVTWSWIGMAIQKNVAHTMAKAYYLIQNCRVDRILWSRMAVEDYVLNMKIQMQKIINSTGPGEVQDDLSSRLAQPVFKYCLSIPRKK